MFIEQAMSKVNLDLLGASIGCFDQLMTISLFSLMTCNDEINHFEEDHFMAVQSKV